METYNEFNQRSDYEAEALRWDGNNFEEVVAFVRGSEDESSPNPYTVFVKTDDILSLSIDNDEASYSYYVRPNDFIVRESNGQYTVYSPETFVQRFDTNEGYTEPVGKYRWKRPNPFEIRALQYNGKNIKQVAAFIGEERIPEVDSETGEAQFSVMWTFTETIAPGDFIAKTDYGVMALDSKKFRTEWSYIVPPRPEPEPEPDPEPEIEEPEIPAEAIKIPPLRVETD